MIRTPSKIAISGDYTPSKVVAQKIRLNSSPTNVFSKKNFSEPTFAELIEKNNQTGGNNQEGSDKEEPKDEYQKFLDTLTEVDNKYSFEYHTPKLDLPGELGGENLVYKMPTHSELFKKAKQSLEAKYISKRDKIKQDQLNKQYDTQKNIKQEEFYAQRKIDKLASQLAENIEKLQGEIVNKGLSRSSIASNLKKQEGERIEGQVDEVESIKIMNVELLEEKIDQIIEETASALESLSQVNDAELQAQMSKLLEDALAQKQEIDKYNNSLTANRSKFLLSKEEVIGKAKRAEQNRIGKIISLYNEIGGNEYRKQALKEKLNLTKMYFDTIGKEKAKELLSSSTILQYYLKDYYDAIVSYVDSMK
ncbi:MAG: hypothetical protein RR248_04035 [Clostridia bacterium]